MPQNTFYEKSTPVQVMAGHIRQQAINLANIDPDLCRHMIALGHNVLTEIYFITQVHDNHNLEKI